jgi:hypothetical protein
VAIPNDGRRSSLRMLICCGGWRHLIQAIVCSESSIPDSILPPLVKKSLTECSLFLPHMSNFVEALWTFATL